MTHPTDVRLTDEQAAQLERAESLVIEAEQHYQAALVRWAAAMRATTSSEELEAVAVAAVQQQFVEAKELVERRQVERDRLRERLYAERALELRRRSLATVVTDQQLRHTSLRQRAEAHAGDDRRGVIGRLFGRRRS